MTERMTVKKLNEKIAKIANYQTCQREGHQWQSEVGLCMRRLYGQRFLPDDPKIGVTQTCARCKETRYRAFQIRDRKDRKRLLQFLREATGTEK